MPRDYIPAIIAVVFTVAYLANQDPLQREDETTRYKH